MIHVDKIVTITLNESLDRQHSTILELNKLGLITEFYKADRDKEDPVRGCFNSHLHVCQDALSNSSCNSLLLFEDDVTILPFHQKQINAINDFIANNIQDFDILYLGLIIGAMWFCGYRSIVRAKGAGAHAYILSRRGMTKFASYQYKGIPVDRIFKREFKCYSVFPIIANQFPEEMSPSALTPVRGDDPKTEQYWKKNYDKQKWILMKNIFKTFSE